MPQRAVLAQTDASAAHAGMGGCNKGLLAGVPMNAVPQATDRLAGLGVARRTDTAEAAVGTLQPSARRPTRTGS
ncbi:hypothetical protein [Streptomyces radiopugnans]|uniref:Uncharacterized protein n=1 Tax=Streptomyces radiopugnans TaxID=403935 RepID=A0A1H9KEX1_9ACTN|nr:hypothetical protein SAMN05216481_1234 [Streptomyces radiopugnans]